MKRTYTAHIMRLDEHVAFLNIDLGFRIWTTQHVFLVRPERWHKFKQGDWVVVSIFQSKQYCRRTHQMEYEYDAVVLYQTKEPTPEPAGTIHRGE